MANDFELFEFTPDVMNGIRDSRNIPVHFYNKDGQILIYKKENASDSELERLFRFVRQGIYYDKADEHILLGTEPPQREIPEGLSDTKLLGEKHADAMAEDASELFGQLKMASITSIQTRRTSETLSEVFTDFENEPDAMNGLVNIIEIMKGKDTAHDIDLAVKRTVVAMAMKMRGLKYSAKSKNRNMEHEANNIMMAALLCDVGYSRMKMPDHDGLSEQEMNYVRNHPLMSYLMVVHDQTLTTEIKQKILCHHRPMREETANNNYPAQKFLLSRLENLIEKYEQDPSRSTITEDIRNQIRHLKSEVMYDEDVNILSVASEFASLTTDVPWREAYSPKRAVQMIINNSFFTHPDRIIREFLDHVSISLCDNEKILKEGDFIILSSRNRAGKTYFEVCVITNSSRYQSRPGVDRLGTILPAVQRTPKFRFMTFQVDTLKPDPRYAHYELSGDDTRHITYAIDAVYDPELYEAVAKLAGNRPVYARKTGSKIAR